MVDIIGNFHGMLSLHKLLLQVCQMLMASLQFNIHYCNLCKNGVVGQKTRWRLAINYLEFKEEWELVL